MLSNSPLITRAAGTLLLAATAAALSACDVDEGPAEEAGRVVDDAAEDAADAVEDAADDLEDAGQDLENP